MSHDISPLDVKIEKGRPSLSPRHKRVAELAALGYPNREIALELKVSEQVVKNLIHSLFDKLGVWNRVELANRLMGDARSTTEREQAFKRIEEQRQAELRRRRILDTSSERVFDELASLAANVFKTPIALVAFMDTGRLWLKSTVGLTAAEVPRELTICNQTIRQSQVFVVRDTRDESCYIGNPLIEEVGVRFYAAAPILTEDGYALGVVCIVDRVPREFSATDAAILQSLAKLAMEQVEMRGRLLELENALPV